MITILRVYNVKTKSQITEMYCETNNKTLTKYFLIDCHIIYYIPI